MKKHALILIVVLAVLGQSKLFSQDKKVNFSIVPGTVVHHSPAYSGAYVGAPSIVITPQNEYIVSLNFTSIKGRDLGRVQKTAIYRSKDRGVSWEFLTEINNQRWSTIFYHRDALYLIGVYEAFGNAVIRKSTDGGRTWTEPKDKTSGLLAEGRYHCAPVPVVVHDGRIWRAMEDAPSGREFRAFMMSAPVDADLMDADSWTFSNKIPYDNNWYNSRMRSWLEGNAVVTKDNTVVDILRCEFSDNTHSKAALVSISDDGKTASFNPTNGFTNLPGGAKKFTIRYDSKTGKYWSLTNWIQPTYQPSLGKSIRADQIRNTLALVSSEDLRDWMVERIVLHHPDTKNHAFQYVDWQFETEDIIAVSRTAYDDGLGGANNYHDANFITFHRIKNFRSNFNLDPQ